MPVPLPFNQGLVKSVRLTQKEFDALPAYSCSKPTLGPATGPWVTMWLRAWGRFPRKPWKHAKKYNGPNKKASDFWVRWYDYCPNDPENYAVTYTAEIEIINETQIKDKESLKLKFER